MGFILEYWFIQ